MMTLAETALVGLTAIILGIDAGVYLFQLFH